MLFEAVDLEAKQHSLSIQWSHGAGDSRPAVSVALDSIEFLPSKVSGSSTKVILAISVPVAVFLALIAGLFVWWRRRKAGRRRTMLDMTESEDGESETAVDMFSQPTTGHLQWTFTAEFLANIKDKMTKDEMRAVK
ncbi:hypothetical protein H1R20_g15663, partial [Candolleomyces eurysporus]